MHGRLAMLKYLVEFFTTPAEQSDGHEKAVADVATVLKMRTRKEKKTLIYSAAYDGHLHVIEYVYEQLEAVELGAGAAFLDVPSSSDVSPIMIAAQQGMPETLLYLLHHSLTGPSLLEVPDNEGTTAAYVASQNGHLDILKIVAEYAPNGPAAFEQTDPEGMLPLLMACQQGHLEIIKYLVETAPSGAKQLEHATQTGLTAAIAAARASNPQVLTYVIDHAPSGAAVLEVADNDGFHPATAAAQDGLLDVLDVICRRSLLGSRILEIGPQQAIVSAAAGENLESVKYIVAHAPSGAALLETARSPGDEVTVALAAAEMGNIPILEYVFEHAPSGGRALEHQTADGLTAAWLVVHENRSLDVLKWLVEHSPSGAAILNIVGHEWRFNLLHMAALHGRLDLLTYVIEHAPPVPNAADRMLQARSSTGCTPLFTAAHSGHLDVVKYILEQYKSRRLGGGNAGGAMRIVDPRLRAMAIDATDEDETALSVAVQNGHFSILKFVVEELPGGADALDIVLPSGETLSFLAAASGNLEMLKYMVNKSPTSTLLLDCRSREGLTLAAVATQTGDVELLRWILDNAPSGNQLLQETDIHRFTPAHMAADAGQLNMLKFIVERGGTRVLEAVGAEHATPAVMAVFENHHEVLEYILSAHPRNRAAVPSRSLRFMFATAAENGHSRIVRLLLQYRGTDAEDALLDLHTAGDDDDDEGEEEEERDLCALLCQHIKTRAEDLIDIVIDRPRVAKALLTSENKKSLGVRRWRQIMLALLTREYATTQSAYGTLYPQQQAYEEDAETALPLVMLSVVMQHTDVLRFRMRSSE